MCLPGGERVSARVSVSRGGVCLGGVCPGGGLPRGCLPGGCLPEGVSAREGVWPGEGVSAPSCEQNDRQV